MLGTRDLALFTATVFVLNATPGVDLMLVLANTLKRGARAGLMTSLAVAAGCIVHTLLAAFVLLDALLRRWSPGWRLRSGLNLADGGLFVLLAARLAWPERA
jgi:threonine/homoserine/homoserine lactone efflux protein